MRTGRRTSGARMTAVVLLKPEVKGRHYRLPSEEDYKAVRKAQSRLARVLEVWEHQGKQGLCPVPDEPLPPIGTLGFRVQRYGMLHWADLFTARQKVALVALGRLVLVQQAFNTISDVCHLVTTMCIDKVAMYNSTGCRWKASGESLMDTFGRQELPTIVWDFAESIPTSGSATGDFEVQTTVGCEEHESATSEFWSCSIRRCH